MQLNHDGRLWVASSNQIFSIDVETGEDAQTVSGAMLFEGLRRSELGEGIVDLLVPETTGDIGLFGMIMESPPSHST